MGEQRKQIDELRTAQRIMNGNGPKGLLANPTERHQQLIDAMKSSKSIYVEKHPERDALQIGYRLVLAERVCLKPLSVPQSMAVKYRVGEPDHAVFHSEPDKNVDR